MHYSRWRSGKPTDDPRPRYRLSQSELLWRHVQVRSFEECWPWAARRNNNGYGQFVLQTPHHPIKKVALAHRLVYESFWRRELDGDCLHRCNNRSCCNPLHLYDGDDWKNQSDSIRAGTHVTLREDWRNQPRDYGDRIKRAKAKINPDLVRELRRRYAAGEPQTALGREFGLTRHAVGFIVRRETWKDVI